MQKLLNNIFVLMGIGILSFSGFGQIENNYVLPSLMLSNEGKRIQNMDQWNQIRRPEILELFEQNVYGKIPDTKLDISYSVIKIDDNALAGKAIQKEVIVTFSNGDESLEMNMLIFLPKNIEKPVPIFLGMNFYGNQTIHNNANISITENYVNNNPSFGISNNKASELSRGIRSHRWPVERILERGYGLAVIYYGDIDPDYDDGFKNGIHHLYQEEKKLEPNAWGSIASWAFGLSKAMDYLVTDQDVDKDKVVVMGHSRLGKTALWAGAIDQRFAITISNDSGCGGAALSRRKQGETVNDINTKFPHWFCKNFHKYNNNEDALLVDQHMLISLIAPRPIYVASAAEDQWADPMGEYLSIYHSVPTYNLFGIDGFKNISMPEINNSVIKGNMGYHIRSGKHDLTLFDWEKFMAFSDNQFRE